MNTKTSFIYLTYVLERDREDTTTAGMSKKRMISQMHLEQKIFYIMSTEHKTLETIPNLQEFFFCIILAIYIMIQLAYASPDPYVFVENK